MTVNIAAISSGYVQEEENIPHVPASIETLEVIQRRLAVNEEVFEEFVPFTRAGGRRVVQMKIKIVVVKTLSKGLAPARSGYFTELTEGLSKRASFVGVRW